jgi:hypothetical protein
LFLLNLKLPLFLSQSFLLSLQLFSALSFLLQFSLLPQSLFFSTLLLLLQLTIELALFSLGRNFGQFSLFPSLGDVGMG